MRISMLAQSWASVPARTCLNIEIAVSVIVFTGEHATEFKLCQLLFEHVEFSHGFVKGFFVVSFDGQLQ
jgi:hypothetical protein